jgi:hypothetical protein
LGEYASTIRSRIESGLLKDLFEGRQSLASCESILIALTRQLQGWAAEWSVEAEESGRLAAKAKVKLDKNVEEFECMGPLAKMFGLRSRILEAARDNARDYYLSMSQVEGAAFAQEFARTIEQGLSESLSSLAAFTATVRESARVCKDKCAQLKPEEVGETAQDFEKRLKGAWVRIFDAKEVENNLKQWIQDETFQSRQAGRAREAVRKDLLLERLEFRHCAKLSRDGLLDCLTKVAVDGLREADLQEREGGANGRLRRLLSVSIVDKLNDRYHGNNDLMRKEIEIIVGSATDFVQFNGSEYSRGGIGTKQDERVESFATAMPAPDQNLPLKTIFGNCSTIPIAWVDTKVRRRHEISLLKFTQLFPLRYLTAVEFLREQYEALLKESPNSERTHLELHTDRDAKAHPSLFAPDPKKALLPKIMLGAAIGSIGVSKSGLMLNYDPNVGTANLRVPNEYPLGKNYSEAIARVNVGNIEVKTEEGTQVPAWKVLEWETEQLLNTIQSEEERKALQEKVVAQVDVLVDKGDESSRSDLNSAAADAVKWLDDQWKNAGENAA